MRFSVGPLFIAGAAFFWGWSYYLLIPFLASGIYIDSEYPLHLEVQSALLSVDSAWYLSYVWSILLSFLCGLLFVGFFSKTISMRFASARSSEVSSGIDAWMIALIIFVQILCYFFIRDFLFRGYVGLAWDEKNSVKSFLSGLNVTLGVICSINLGRRGLARQLSVVALFVNSLVLLGMGGRLYVVVAALTVLVSQFISGRISKKIISILGCGAFALMLAVGLLRQGELVTTGGLVYIFLGEAVLNWLGGVNFISSNVIDRFEAPHDLVVSFFSFIPTFVWPGKYDFLASLKEGGFIVDSPVGGTNLVISLLSNFGYIGSSVAVFFFGIFTGLFCRLSRWSVFLRCAFSAHVALMAFMFFRDSLVIHQKCLIINAMLLPLFLSLASRVKVFR